MNDSSGGSTPSETTHWVQFFGAFHPVVVHFPIALLLTAGLLELVSVWKNDNRELRFAIEVNLGLGALGAVVAAALGWLDAAHMGFEPDLKPVLAWHRWLGTSVAIGSAITAIFWFFKARRGSPVHRWLYRGAVWLVSIVLGIAGHLGGLLVYGLDYFSP